MDHKNKWLRLGLVVSITAIWVSQLLFFSSSCESTDQPAGQEEAHLDTLRSSFVGSETCKSCHNQEYDEWENSHHDEAMKKATPESVKGDFSGVTVEFDSVKWRFYREDSTYFVNTLGPDGNYQDFPITYTFGVFPLQQYIVDFPKGKYQVMTVAWDQEKERWFNLYDDVEDVKPNEWIHWTQGGMTWNTMCSSCHSTFNEKNYFHEADSFATDYQVINVSCESCHGGGKQHVQAYREGGGGNGESNYEEGEDHMYLTSDTPSKAEVEQCGRCHMRREQISNVYIHGDSLLNHYIPELIREPNYFADGQIKEEDYVYGSFLQSRMYHAGVTCSNCHNPHTLELKQVGNDLCNSCHDPDYFDSEEHHFHPVETEGAECVNCHMDGRTYMGIDYRRDHSFRIPDPELTVEFGTPNACNSCHEDRSAEWAANKIDQWQDTDEYQDFHGDMENEVTANLEGQKKYIMENEHQDYQWAFARAHEGDTAAIAGLKNIVNNEYYSSIIRATAVWHIAQFGRQQDDAILLQSLDDQDPLIRYTAAQVVTPRLTTGTKREYLLPMLQDSIKAVRMIAFEGIRDLNPENISQTLRPVYNEVQQEYEDFMYLNADFPSGQMRIAQYFEAQNETGKAINAYEKAIQLDTLYNAARLNLAHIYNNQGQQQDAAHLFQTVTDLEPAYGPAWYSLGLLYAGQGDMEKAAEVLKEAATRMTENPRVFYNYGLALQNLERAEEAEQQFKNGLEVAPQDTDLRYALAILYIQQQELEKAQEQVDWLIQRHPNNQNIQNLQRNLQQQMMAQ